MAAIVFQAGLIDGVAFKPLTRNGDHRGWLVELFRRDEMAEEHFPAMAYLSETLPGVVRGPHEHVEQTDCFAFLGPGDFRLYLWDARPASPTHRHCMTVVVGESNPQAILVPPGVVHAYKNIGPGAAWVFNAPNRLYAGPGKQGPVDEIRHEDDADSPYHVD